MGRFDVLKLYSYLHGLNWRLTHENKALAEQLAVDGGGRSSSQLGAIADDPSAEELHLTDLQVIDAMSEELQQMELEKLKLEEVLKEELELRTTEKDKFKSRLAEVAARVETIDLERRLVAAEQTSKKARQTAEQQLY